MVMARIEVYGRAMPGAPRSAVILGGSVAGGAAALQLARAGWQVTLVDPELDRMASPGRAVTHRPGAPHTVHAHGFGSRAHLSRPGGYRTCTRRWSTPAPTRCRCRHWSRPRCTTGGSSATRT